MWIGIANKFVKFPAKRPNRSENITKRFRGVATFFLKHPVYPVISSRQKLSCVY